MQKRRQGFTLIELIVVIAILAILAVALIPLINSFIEKSRVSQIMTTTASLETAAIAFNADIGIFPPDNNADFTDTELVTSNRNNWDGPYLNRNTEGVSPWGSSMELSRVDASEMNVGDAQKDEYILLVNSDSGAVVPEASFVLLDTKVDGSNDGGSGKCQRENKDNSDGSGVQMVIIADAFLDSTNTGTGNS
jgi:prepilin-type N-terminal cleavage/methylation domain-containing protein